MKIYRKSHMHAGTIAVFFICYLYLPFASAGLLNGPGWKVERDDTLYKICRAIYPGDGRKQARLGWDIKKLNPSIFDNGANK